MVDDQKGHEGPAAGPSDLALAEVLATARWLAEGLEDVLAELHMETDFDRRAAQDFEHFLLRVATDLELLAARPAYRHLASRQADTQGLFQAVEDTRPILARARTRFSELANAPDTRSESAVPFLAACSDLAASLNSLRSAVSATHIRLQLTDSPPEVFICYSCKDRDFARKLADDLAQSGFKVWFDEWAMLPGDSLYDRIQGGIRCASWFIIVLSPDSVSSKWCRRELHAAMEEEFARDQVYVIPLICRTCSVPGFLREKLWVDCRGESYKDGLARLQRRFLR